MREEKFHIYLNDDEYSRVIQSLIRLKNSLIAQGRYTDGVDDVLCKVLSAKKERSKLNISKYEKRPPTRCKRSLPIRVSSTNWNLSASCYAHDIQISYYSHIRYKPPYFFINSSGDISASAFSLISSILQSHH